MKILYLDEAGLSADEEVLVVAGVSANADRDYDRAIAAMADLRQRYDVPEDQLFHAMKILTGRAPWRRDRWTFEDRLKILDELVRLPRGLGLPIVGGYVRKAADPAFPVAIDHATAYILCMTAMELLLIRRGRAGECAVVVAEDNTDTRRALKAAHALVQKSDASGILNMLAPTRSLPLTRIKGALAVATKAEEPLLQIADAVTFVMKRFLLGFRRSEELLAVMCGPDVATARPNDHGNDFYFDWSSSWTR